MSTTYSIQDTTLTNLGNALRTVWGTTDTFTPAQMASSINDIGEGTVISLNNIKNNHINPLTNRWQRPNNWPDIDALADAIEGDQDCVYFTYDLSLHEDFHYIGLYVNMSQGDTWYLDRYDAGDFVHTHFEMSKDSYLRYDLTEEPDNSQVQVWRLTSNGHISTYGFTPWTNDFSSNNIPGVFQPCVDRSGTLPWYSSISSNNTITITTNNTRSTITFWLEHDSLVIGKNTNLTILNSYWAYASNLVSIDLSKWNTTNWHITSLSSCWYNCSSLKELKLNYWNTTNWQVTSLASCWSNCYALEKLEVNQWDTENWAITTLSSTWNSCCSLKKLDLNNWNTENWAVTTLSSTWYGCRALTELKIDQWNTENWAVTNLSGTWSNCHSLKKLDLNNWDTTNWAVTTLGNTWNYCYALRSLKINLWNTTNWVVNTLSMTWCSCRNLQQCESEEWDVSNWNPKSLSSTWSGCYNLQKLDLSKWDTSNWDALTDISNTWSECYSLQELKISSLLENDFSITSINSTWYNCYSLKRLDLNNWDTSNWTIKSLQNIWAMCYNLVELNIDQWDLDNCIITNMSNAFSSCYSLKELNLGNWDASNWNITSASNIAITGLYSITSFIYPQNLDCSSFTGGIGISSVPSLLNIGNISQYVNHSYSGVPSLTSTCLKNILKDLPTVSSTKTITLGGINKLKLTAEDLAVATNKGWTVA